MTAGGKDCVITDSSLSQTAMARSFVHVLESSLYYTGGAGAQSTTSASYL